MKNIVLEDYISKSRKALKVSVGFGDELKSILSEEQSILVLSYRKYLVIETDCGNYVLNDDLWAYIDSASYQAGELEAPTAYRYMFDSKVKSSMCIYKGRKMIMIYPEEDNSQFIMWDRTEDIILSCRFTRDNMNMPCLTLSADWVEQFGSADLDYVIDLAIKKGL